MAMVGRFGVSDRQCGAMSWEQNQMPTWEIPKEHATSPGEPTSEL